MNYKNYTIEPDNTGYAPKNMVFGIFKEEEYIGSGGTVEECKKLIDENILEDFEKETEAHYAYQKELKNIQAGFKR